MLKKKERLNRDEFNRFFSIGKRFHSPYLQIIYTKHDSFHGAVVVGKKVFKHAVDRNSLRRRLYAALYRHHTEHKTTGVFIVITKPAIIKLSKKEVSTEVTDLLQKIQAT